MGLLENWTNSLQEKQGSGTTSQKGFDAQIASTEKQIQDTLAEIGKVYGSSTVWIASRSMWNW